MELIDLLCELVDLLSDQRQDGGQRGANLLEFFQQFRLDDFIDAHFLQHFGANLERGALGDAHLRDINALDAGFHVVGLAEDKIEDRLERSLLDGVLEGLDAVACLLQRLPHVFALQERGDLCEQITYLLFEGSEGGRDLVVHALCQVSDHEIELLLQGLEPVKEGVDRLADLGAAHFGLFNQGSYIQPGDDAFDLCLDSQNATFDFLNPAFDLLQRAADLGGKLLRAAFGRGGSLFQVLLDLLGHAPDLVDGRGDGVQSLGGAAAKGIDIGLHEDGIGCIQIEDATERLVQLGHVVGKQRLQRGMRLLECRQVGQQRRVGFFCQRADQLPIFVAEQIDLVEQQAVAGCQTVGVAVGILRLLAERDGALYSHEGQSFLQPVELLQVDLLQRLRRETCELVRVGEGDSQRVEDIEHDVEQAEGGGCAGLGQLLEWRLQAG